MKEPKEKIKVYSIIAVLLRRKEDSDWEPGFIFSEGDHMIMDAYGKEVKECWDYRRFESILSLNLSGIIDQLEKLHASWGDDR